MSRAVTWVLVALVRIYQWTLSPVLGGACRFLPSCSEYAIDALREHGPIQGTLLAVRRVLRCHPFHPGGLDPVPGRCGHVPQGERDGS